MVVLNYELQSDAVIILHLGCHCCQVSRGSHLCLLCTVNNAWYGIVTVKLVCKVAINLIAAILRST